MAMPMQTGAQATAEPAAKGAGGGTRSGFGLSDLMSFLSPGYAMTQGKSPFAGGFLGMAIPGMGPTAEQKTGFGAFMNPMLSGGGMVPGSPPIMSILQMLGKGGFQGLGGLGSLLQGFNQGGLQVPKLQDRLMPEPPPALLPPKTQYRLTPQE